MSDLHLSQTQLEMLSRCGEQYRRRYIEREIIPPGVAMLVGGAVDDSVSANLGAKIAHGELNPLGDTEAVAADSLRARWNREGVVLSEEEAAVGPARARDQAVDRAVRLSRVHATGLAPTLAPTHVQRRWEIDLAPLGRPAKLVGVIDVQEGVETMRDTKTTGKSPASDEAEKSIQLTMYSMAGAALDGAPPQRVTLDYLVEGRAAPVVLTSERTERDHEMVLRRVDQALKVIKAGAFTPTSPSNWWCSKRWCGYWATCPFAGRR